MYKEFILPVIGCFFALIYFLSTRNLPGESVTYSYLVLTIMVVLSVIILLSQVMKYKNKPELKDNKNSEKSEKNQNTSLIIVAFTIVYIIILNLVGYILATFIFLASTIIYLGLDKKRAVVISFVTTFIIFIIFGMLLRVEVPAGIPENFIKSFINFG